MDGSRPMSNRGAGESGTRGRDRMIQLQMSLEKGDRLGPYEILAPIGAGGMGEVYRARDTRLGRDVAIKVSAQQFTERFEREARAVAALNHPNICHLYDVATSPQGFGYLVMEFIEGESPKGPAPIEETLKIARQIAAALEAAHEAGIVHRDLKPANIKIKPDGTVKVLDFGLAKIAGASEPASQNSPTITMNATQAGMILGTAAYMSPEQARGKRVDKRADIWAFGVVLYELLTGDRLFDGETIADTLIDVATRQPDMQRVPSHLRPLLEKCLQKDPAKRLRDIADMDLLLMQPQSPPIDTPSQSRLSWWGWVTAGVLALAAIPLAYSTYHHQTEEAPHMLRFTVPPPEGGSLANAMMPQLSPDGRHIAYVARVDGASQLWVRDLDSLTSRALVKENTRYPFWSPDSRSIAFWTGGKLQKIDITGGPALSLCSAVTVTGGTWNREGVIVFATNLGPLQRVSAAGGTPVPVTTLDASAGEVGHVFPWFLPDGRHFLYMAGSGDEKDTIYAGDLQSKDTRTKVMVAKSNAVYVPAGYLLFARERALMAQPFDPSKLITTGDAFPVVDKLDTRQGPSRGYFSASENGVLAYTSGAQAENVQMTWFDRSGKALGTVGPPADIDWAALSPDGKTVAFDSRDPQTGYYDIWLRDLARGTDSRFTFNSKNNRFPVWSPDNTSLAYLSDRAGHGNVYKRAITGIGQEDVVHQDELDKRPTSWTPDGRFIVEETNGTTPKTRNDIWIAPASIGSTAEKPRPYLQTEFVEGQATISPNGKWLAYHSDETKRREVYIMTFPQPGGKWQVSTSGGGIPIWSRDGKQLFYIGGNNKMIAVDIKGAGVNPEPGVPQALFDVRLGPNNPSFDVSKDGRFLIPSAVEQTGAAPITVVVNWTAGLKK